MATSTRAWLGLQGVSRQGQARSARQVAEAGMSQLIEDLNSNYSHLLIVDEDQWSNPPITSGVCASKSSSGAPSTTGDIGSEGRYELENYTFSGNPFYGGTADIRMKGEILKNNNSTLATSIVEQTIRIIPKNCETSLNQPSIGGFPGLLAQSINIGNNDIRGLNANAMCLQCGDIATGCAVNSNTPFNEYSESDKECVIGSKKNSVIDGEIYIGPRDLPSVPRIPTALDGIAASTVEESETIVAGSSDQGELLNGSCIVDSDNITHCLINEITLSGKNAKLTIDTSSGDPVRIYVTDDIKLSGKGSIIHIPTTAPAARVGLFGQPIDNDQSNDQEVEVAGNSKIDNMWVFFPDGKVGVNGGGKVTVSCTGGDCSGGNFHGAVWAKEWGMSQSNAAAITVPANFGEEIETYYKGYSFGMKDYAAVGVSEWNNLITDNQ